VWRGGAVSVRLVRVRTVFFAAFVLAASAASTANAAAVTLHVDASLIADSVTPAAGSPLWVGLKMHHDAGWHTYWKNPGDAGMPTRITWTLPEGWTASGINWPAPARLQLGPLASYGYAGDAVLPVKLSLPAGWNAKLPAQIVAHTTWLVCKEQCIPEGADLVLNLPAHSSAADRGLLDIWRARIPQMTRFKVASAERKLDRMVLTLEPAADGQFFPDREELIEPGDPPQVSVSGSRVSWSAKLGVQGKALAAPASVAGVWVPKAGNPVFVEAKLK
jgi:DsbC/DsbD-like thiol-disulfide interchange protein